MIGRAALLLLALGAAKDDPLAGRTAGTPAECIDLDRVEAPQPGGACTLLYRQNGQRVWQTVVERPCPAMRPNDGVIAQVQGRRLCRGDLFRIRRPGYVLGGVHRFGSFVPYDKTPQN